MIGSLKLLLHLESQSPPLSQDPCVNTGIMLNCKKVHTRMLDGDWSVPCGSSQSNSTITLDNIQSQFAESAKHPDAGRIPQFGPNVGCRRSWLSTTRSPSNSRRERALLPTVGRKGNQRTMSCSSIVIEIASSDNDGAQTCSSNGGYGFVTAAAPISPEKAKIMCSVEACKQLVAAIRAAQSSECTYTSRGGRPLQLYADILTPIALACPANGTPSTTTPAPAPLVTTTSSATSGSSDGSSFESDSSFFDNDNWLGSDSSGGSPTPAPTPRTPAPSATVDDTAASKIHENIKANTSAIFTVVIVFILIVFGGIIGIAFFKFRRSRQRSRKPTFVDPEFGQVGDAFATNGTYVPHTGTTIATGMSGASKGKASIPIGLAGGTIGLWSDRDIQNARIPLEDIKLGPILSAGAFGEVLLASYNGEKVAVKRLLPARRKDMTQIESFLEEAKLMTTLRHQRIVRLIGVAWDSLTDLCVVTEFMNGGDLRTLLAGFASRNAQVGFNSDKVKIAVHVVHALSYLHGLRPIVVHRDLKSKNVLLSDALDAKLTDFGVSRTHAELTMTAGVGTSLWMAPEIMLGQRYDEKADIFSFGVLLSEIDTHRLPYADAMEPGTQRQLSEIAILNMVSQGKLRVSFSDAAGDDMIAIGRACTSVNPQDRPSANEVLRQLHHVWQSYGGIV